MNANMLGTTVKVECDAYTGYATIVRIGKSGTWATVQVCGGTMMIGAKDIVD
jgi:hypothetical protein